MLGGELVRFEVLGGHLHGSAQVHRLEVQFEALGLVLCDAVCGHVVFREFEIGAGSESLVAFLF